MFTAEREARKSSFKQGIAMESKVEGDLELRHDIFEIMKVGDTQKQSITFKKKP